MMNTLFGGIFDTSTTSVISVSSFLLCVAVSLVIGLFISAVFGYKSKSSQSFLVTLALLPAVVCVVIMMVNGNVGAGVAVAGAFSLVRFRSAPGTAREIGAIFLAMASGLLTGMGYLGYAVLFAVIIGLVNFLYESIGWKKAEMQTGKTLHITIPENLDYTNIFDEIFKEFTKSCEMVNVKTTNMGSLFKLTYQVELKEDVSEKDFIDKLRCRNGNLEIVMARRETVVGDL
ncbi:MAG: DUF4956 domain-containing protein [Lachnospiraceae bacterium]|nr:DUF4956 domain-containing protein [Lachnospiraceae bacterium]